MALVSKNKFKQISAFGDTMTGTQLVNAIWINCTADTSLLTISDASGTFWDAELLTDDVVYINFSSPRSIKDLSLVLFGGTVTVTAWVQ